MRDRIRNWMQKRYKLILIILIVGGLCRIPVFWSKLLLPAYNWWLSVKDVPLNPLPVIVVLGLLSAILIVFLTKKSKKQKHSVLEQINQRIELSIKNIKCSGYIFRLPTSIDVIRKCDMYITDDALILFMNGNSPIIYTHNQEYSKFRFAEIYNKVSIAFDEQVVIKSTFIKIKLKNLTDAEKKSLQGFAHENCFTIIHHK